MTIEHVAFNVPEPVAMAGWYAKHLGLRVVRSSAGPPFTHFLVDATGRTVIEIYHRTDAAVPDYRTLDPLVLHLAFGTADLGATRERLLAAGATPAGEVAVTPAGDELAFLRDPWGFPIQLVRRARPLIEAGGSK